MVRHGWRGRVTRAKEAPGDAVADLILTSNPPGPHRGLRRALVGAAGLAGSALTWWAAGPYLAPLPVAGALLANASLLPHRPRDTLTLTADRIRVTTASGSVIEVGLDAISTATLLARAHGPTLHEVAVVLGDDADVRLALLVFQTEAPRLPAVDIRAMDALLGAIAGLERPSAPPDRRPRYRFIDPDGALLQQLGERLPPRVWARTGVRTWPGAEPALDPRGFHVGPPAGRLLLDGRWSYRGQSGPLDGWSVGLAERALTLELPSGGTHRERLLLATLNLPGGGPTVVFPAPTLAGLGPIRPTTDGSLHTHAPEGAALLWHLLVATPPSRWPAPLRAMIGETGPIRDAIERSGPDVAPI